ncbi:MAG: hypothetical protein R2865_14780 [Deinococcales bacterium]
MFSAVLYIGSAGRGDQGEHRMGDALLWRYEVIRLEDMSSTDLLATDSLPLIAMMGLSKLRHPQDMLKGLDKLRTEADNTKKRTLYDVFCLRYLTRRSIR